MTISELTADHDGDAVVLRDPQRNKIARIPAEDAVQLAREIIAQADKALWHNGEVDGRS